MGRIAVRAGGKHLPGNAEVTLKRTRASEMERRVKDGVSRRRHRGGAPGGRRLLKAAANGAATAQPNASAGSAERSVNVLAMYDIAISADGEKWQPAAGEPVRVTVELDEPVTVKEGAPLGVVHLSDDGEVEELDSSRYGFTYDATRTAVTAFWFDATGFSVYAITESGGTYSPNRRLYDFYSLDFDRFLEDGVTPNPTYNTYVPRYFTTVEGNRTFRQIVKSGEMLARPEVLPSPLGRTFIGWFLYATNKANQTVEGVTYDSEGYATTKFDFTKPIEFADTPDGGDENHGAREFVLRSRFAREGYVIFHEQPVGGDWPITAVRRAEMTEQVDGSETNMVASVNISDLKVTYDDTNDTNQEGQQHENTAPRMIFRGWSETPVLPGKLTDTNGNNVVILQNPYVFSRVKDTEARPRHLFPVFANINWLTFLAAEAGAGATYIPPRFYYQDEGTNTFPVSSRTGYVFDGWWTTSNDVAGVTGVQVSTPAGALRTNFTSSEKAAIGTWGGKIEGGNLMLTNNVTLYGRWNVGKTKYTVVIWQQKVTDAANLDDAHKTYDFVASYTNTATTANTVSVPQTYKNYSYENFHYARCDGEAVVNGNGSTVLNVYYDRNVHTLTFFTTTSTKYINYTYNGYNYSNGRLGSVVTSTTTINTLEGLGSSNKKTISGYEVAKSGSTYYLKIGTSWYQISSDGSNVFAASSISIPALAHYETGLAGSIVSGVFPIEGYTGKTWTGNTYYTQRLASFELMPDTDITFTLANGQSKHGVLYYYVEVGSQDEMGADGTTNDGKYYKLYKTIEHDYNFLTKKEDFHNLNGYTQSDTDVTWNSSGQTSTLSDNNEHRFYYDRNDQTIEFKDSYTQTVLKKVDVKYSDDIEGHVPADPESTRPGYLFTGWYADEACSTRVFFDQAAFDASSSSNKMFYAKMPANNLQFFAGWETEWYLIKIDPNYGKLPSGQSTWFWEPYNGDPIEEYSATTRSFVEAVNGTWFYAIKNRDYYGYPDEWVSGEAGDRGAYYTQNQSDPAIVQDGKRYKEAVNAYRYAGWYEVDPDTGAETLYAFGQPVQRNTTLRLHWKHIGTYRLHYEPNIGTMSDGDENETTFNILDAGVYADSSEVLVTRTAVPPPGYAFAGWRIRYGDGEVLHPGQQFYFNSAYTVTVPDANGNPVQQLVLDAVYSKVSTVSLTTDANGGWVDPEVAVTLPLAYPNAPALITNITDTARTVSGMRNNAYGTLSDGDGYHCIVQDEAGNDVKLNFLGWNTKADGTGTHFDGGTFIGVDTLDAENGHNVLYAEWGVRVYFDKNRDTGVWHDDLWQAQSDTYAWDPEKEMYYQETTLNGYAKHPRIPLTSTAEDEMFKLWSTNRYTAVEQLEEFDFSQPITRPITLHARWSNFIRVPFHVVDSSHATPVLMDGEWLNEEHRQFKIGNYADVSFAGEPSQYLHDVPPTHEYAFTCVSASPEGVSDAADRRIVRMYYNAEPGIRTVYVDYANGTTGPMSDDKEIYVVYYANPRPIKIAYEKMETDGGLTPVATNAASAAPGWVAVDGDATNMATVAKAPKSYPVDSSGFKYYAYAIGETNAASSAQLRFITGAKGLDDSDRPVLWIRNTWRGCEYCTGDPLAENAVWNRYGADAQLYVVYFTSQTTIVNFKELTVGTEADRAERFEYVVAVSNVTVTVTETQTGTRDGGHESKPWIGSYTQDEGYWWSSSDIKWTWSDSTPSKKKTVEEVTPVAKSLKDHEIESVALFHSVTPAGNWEPGEISTSSYSSGWPYYDTYYRQTRTRTRTSVTNSQMVVITQRPKEAFRTVNDIGDGEYVFTQTSAATNAAYRVTFTNTRKELPVELHVAFSQNGTIDHVDNAWRSETTNDYTVAVALKEDGTFAVAAADLEAKEGTLIRAGLDLGDRRFMGVYYGKADESDGADENKAVLKGKVTSVGLVKPEGSEHYELCLNGDPALKLAENRLYCVYCAMPRLYYVATGANGSLTKRDAVAFEGNAVSMGNPGETEIVQGTLLEVGADAAYMVAAGGGAADFRVPLVIDGVEHASLSRMAFGAGAADAASTNAMNVVTSGASIRLKVVDAVLKWSVDGQSWGDFTGAPAIYSIYKEAGHDLTITEISIASGVDKEMDEFMLTIKSDNLTNGVTYLVSGYRDESVTPTPDGVITLTLTNGCSITIQSLPNDGVSAYVLTETLPEVYALTNLTVDGNVPLVRTDFGTSVYMQRDAFVEFTNIKRYDVTFVDEDGTTPLTDATPYWYGTKAAEITAPGSPAKAMDATNLYRFTAWNPALEDVGSNTVYTATYRAIKIPQATQRAAATNITVTLSREEPPTRETTLIAALNAAGIDLEAAGYSEEAATAKLNARDANGLRRWENLVTGTAFDQLLLGTAVSAGEKQMAFRLTKDSDPPTGLGYTVLHDLRRWDAGARTWNRVAGPTEGLDPAFDIQLTDADGKSTGAAGFYRVTTLIVPDCAPAITNVIPSTNIIGVLEVASTLKNTMTAVPWKALASAPEAAQPVAVQNLVDTAQLGDGDKINVLNGDGVYQQWTLGSDGWKAAAATVLRVNGVDTAVVTPKACDCTLERGGTVWVSRENATRPYFLIGQYTGESVTLTIEGSKDGSTPACVMVSNPSIEPLAVNDIEWNGKPTDVDRIWIPTEKTAPLTLRWRNGEWGQYVADPKTRRSVWKSDYTIAPGTGFWYNRYGPAFDITLNPVKPTEDGNR